MDSSAVKQIAHLARLSLSEKETVEAAEKLSQILKYFEKMTSLPTDQVEPLLTPTEIEDYLRPDEPESYVTTEELLANAPSSQGYLFKVPPVVGG